jgi:hypothetical protein
MRAFSADRENFGPEPGKENRLFAYVSGEHSAVRNRFDGNSL